jgi:hypothetical protein
MTEEIWFDSRHGKETSSPKRQDRLWVYVQPPIPCVPASLPTKVKLPGSETKHSALCNVEVKNEYICIPTPVSSLRGVWKFREYKRERINVMEFDIL